MLLRKSFGDELSNIHHLEFPFLLLSEPGGTQVEIRFTGRTGRDHDLCPRTAGLLDPFEGYFQTHIRVVSFHTPATATALGKISIQWKFNQFNRWEGPDHITGWVVNVHMAPEIARVVVRHLCFLTAILKIQSAFFDELFHVFHDVKNLNPIQCPVLGIEVLEGPVASGTRGHNFFEFHVFEKPDILVDTTFEFFLTPNKKVNISAAIFLAPQAGKINMSFFHDL